MEDTMNNEEEFLLKWNNHQSNLINVFKDWLRDESFVDITLVCGGEAVSGHKVVLAACSPLLNKILHDNPCHHPVVILNDVCSTDMKALLKFIYHGEVSVSQGELASFLKIADNLQIKGLAEDKEKDEKKRKDKDDLPTEVTKKRKTDVRQLSNSQEQSRTHKSKQESITSSPKSDTKYTTSKDTISSLNSHPNQLPSGGLYSNSINHQMLTDTSLNNTSILDQEYDISLHNSNLQPEILVVKSEPLDYGGEMVWQEGNSLLKKENSDLGDNVNITSNASSSSSSSSNSSSCSGSQNLQQTHSTTLPFGVLHSSLESFGSSCTADILQKNLELALSGDEKKSEEENKTLSIGSEELNQSSFITTYEENAEEEAVTLGSPGKFRGGRKPCCFCGKTFCDNYTLRRHMVTHLSRQRQFECSLCSAAYSRKDHLMAHMRRKHPIGEYEIETSSRPS